MVHSAAAVQSTLDLLGGMVGLQYDFTGLQDLGGSRDIEPGVREQG